VPPGEARRLAELLTAAGASVTEYWSSGGHALTREDVTQARAWLNSAGFGS
jgi:phospholipase/carboxylesterase